MQKNEGYLERIQYLNEVKKIYKHISDLFQRKGNKDLLDLEQFTKDYLDNINKK
jgi:hypothetical protein